MYTVDLIHRGRKHTVKFDERNEATSFARTFWNLEPLVKDPDGNPVLWSEVDEPDILKY